MRTRVTDRRSDGRTDGAGYIRPAEGHGGSKNTVMKFWSVIEKVPPFQKWVPFQCLSPFQCFSPFLHPNIQETSPLSRLFWELGISHFRQEEGASKILDHEQEFYPQYKILNLLSSHNTNHFIRNHLLVLDLDLFPGLRIIQCITEWLYKVNTEIHAQGSQKSCQVQTRNEKFCGRWGGGQISKNKNFGKS